MPRYRVYLTTFATTTVEVEAVDGDRAVEAALEGDLPYASAFAGYELGEWSVNSDLVPYAKPEDDYKEIG